MGGRHAAITGVGYTDFSRDSGVSVLRLATDACRRAIDDAGAALDTVDGIVSFQLGSDSVPAQAVATTLGLRELRFGVDLNLGGQAPCHLASIASAAVTSGQARSILVFRAMNGRSGARVGGMEFPGGGAQYRYPIDYSAYMLYVAMWARRFLHETGQGELDLAAVPIAQRLYAQSNPRSARRRPLDVEAYMASPMVAEPFRAPDCTVEVDGACAILVTSLEAARDLAPPPAVIASACYRAGPRSGLDIGDHLLWDDYTRNYTSFLRDELFGRAGISADDVDFAEIYDCFSSTVLIGLEGLGFCDRGASGDFVRRGETALDGSLPVNTNGGLLAEGYVHGMNTLTEAVLQIQGRGVCQVDRHEVGVVTSGALMDGSAMLLTADRGGW